MKFQTRSLQETIKKLAGISRTNTAEAQKGILLSENTLSASNKELAMCFPVDQPSFQAEEFILPQKSFAFINSLSGDEVEITCVDNTLTITCGKAKSTVKTFNLEGYVKPEFLVSENPAVINADVLTGAFSSVLYAIDENQKDKRMTACYVSSEGETLNFTAINGVQIASAAVPYTGELKMLVPKKAITELLKMKAKGDVKLSSDGKGVTFAAADGSMLYSRLYEEEYFNTAAFLTQNLETSTISKMQILEALSRVNACASADSDSKNPVILEFGQDGLKVSYKGTPDYEEVLDDVNIGKDLRIGFSPKLITESLGSVPGEEVAVCFTGPNKPLTIKGGGTTAILMPVNLK